MDRRIARRIQYALPAVEKPSFENRPRSEEVCYLITPVLQACTVYINSRIIPPGRNCEERLKSYFDLL